MQIIRLSLSLWNIMLTGLWVALAGVAGCSHVPMEKAAFEGWLESVSAAFLTLNDQQRNQSLDQLISLSGAVQLRHLSNGLETLLKRDFLRLLPLELAFYLLRWLDPQTLLTCCLVCKQWNKVHTHLPAHFGLDTAKMQGKRC